MGQDYEKRLEEIKSDLRAEFEKSFEENNNLKNKCNQLDVNIQQKIKEIETLKKDVMNCENDKTKVSENCKKLQAQIEVIKNEKADLKNLLTKKETEMKLKLQETT